MTAGRRDRWVVAVAIWGFAVWLVAADRHATSADPELSPTWTVADVARAGVVVTGGTGAQAFHVEDGRAVPVASVAHDETGSRRLPHWRCGSPACDSIVVTEASGYGVDAERGPLVRSPAGTTTPLVTSPNGHIEILHAGGAGHFLGLLHEPGHGVQLVEVLDGSVQPLAAAGGPGARVTSAPAGGHVAVESGVADGGVGLPRHRITHWLSSGEDGHWRVVRSERDARVLCLSDDGTSVVERAGTAIVEEASGVRYTLPFRPVAGFGARVPCAVGDHGVLVAAPFEGGGVVVLDRGRPPVGRWGIGWTDRTGRMRAVLRPDARRVALSANGRLAAVVTEADEVVVYAESGERKNVASSVVDLAFLPSGELVVLRNGGAVRVLSPTELP